MSLWTKFRLARNRISVDLWKVHQLPRSYFNLFWIVDNSSYRRYEKRFWVVVFMQIFLRTAHFRIGEVWSLYLLLPLTCHLYRSWSLFPAIEQHLSQPFFFHFVGFTKCDCFVGVLNETCRDGEWLFTCSHCFLPSLRDSRYAFPIIIKVAVSQSTWKMVVCKQGNFDATDKLLIRRQSYIFWASNTENCSSIINWNQPSFGLLQCKTIITIFRLYFALFMFNILALFYQGHTYVVK